MEPVAIDSASLNRAVAKSHDELTAITEKLLLDLQQCEVSAEGMAAAMDEFYRAMSANVGKDIEVMEQLGKVMGTTGDNPHLAPLRRAKLHFDGLIRIKEDFERGG